MDEAAGIESPTNKQKGTTPQVIAKAGNTWRNGHTRGIGNTRIEAEAGGAARLAMPELDSGAIDKVTDARASNRSSEAR